MNRIEIQDMKPCRNGPMIWTRVRRPISGKRTVFSKNDIGETGDPKEWSCTLPSHHIQKLTQKWTKNLNITPKTINLLEENVGGMLS